MLLKLKGAKIIRSLHYKKCPVCEHKIAVKNGHKILRNKKVQVWRCKNCAFQFTEFTSKTFPKIIEKLKKKYYNLKM